MGTARHGRFTKTRRRGLLLALATGGVVIAAACTPVKPGPPVPAAPSTPDLAASSDSGLNTDNITNDTTPTFDGTAEAGATVKVFDDLTQIGSGVATGGNYSITSSELVAGVHEIRATATNAQNGASPASPKLDVTIDTTPPPTSPSTPDLVTGDDSGVSATDNVTRDSTPTFTGTANAGLTVRLFSGGTQLLGTATADGSGDWSINAASGMGDGTHSVTATQADLAGNQSAAGGALSVRIDTTVPIVGLNTVTPDPSTSTPVLSGPAGTAFGDLVTVTVKIYEGTSTSGVLKQTLTANVLAGVWATIPSPPLATGVYTVQASQGDTAGNSGDSTIDTFTVS